MADDGLCLTDFMILEALLHKGPLTITEIQGKILLASGSVTAAVNGPGSGERGALVRQPIQQDRRARQLFPLGGAAVNRANLSGTKQILS